MGSKMLVTQAKLNYKPSLFLFFTFLFIFFGNIGQVAAETFGEDEITVGSCVLSVYTATDVFQKASGMLGFTDDTFGKDGMIFFGKELRSNFFHTMNMKMDIVIMGLIKTGEKTYKVSGKPLEALPGMETIKIYGESVLEVPLKLYYGKLKECLKPNGKKK